MKDLEGLAAEGMKAMNTMYDTTAVAQVKCGQIKWPNTGACRNRALCVDDAEL